jgi:energy-coupling factor transporter transmembrane protein EcfT
MDEGPSRASLATGATVFVASYVYSVAKYGFLDLLVGWIPAAVVAIAVPIALRYLFSLAMLGAALLVSRRSRF